MQMIMPLLHFYPRAAVHVLQTAIVVLLSMLALAMLYMTVDCRGFQELTMRPECRQKEVLQAEHGRNNVSYRLNQLQANRVS